MSIIKGLIDSFGSIFFDANEPDNNRSLQSPNQTSSSSTMDSGGSLVGNERTAHKLKGYFDLAKEEIARAVRAEEWGLVDDAIQRYKAAQRVLAEGMSVPVPSFISSRYERFVDRSTVDAVRAVFNSQSYIAD